MQGSSFPRLASSCHALRSHCPPCQSALALASSLRKPLDDAKYLPFHAKPIRSLHGPALPDHSLPYSADRRTGLCIRQFSCTPCSFPCVANPFTSGASHPAAVRVGVLGKSTGGFLSCGHLIQCSCRTPCLAFLLRASHRPARQRHSSPRMLGDGPEPAPSVRNRCATGQALQRDITKLDSPAGRRSCQRQPCVRSGSLMRRTAGPGCSGRCTGVSMGGY